MTLFLTRCLRAVGVVAWFGSVGVVVGVLAWQCVQGAGEGQSLWPSSRLWGLLLNSLFMATVATITSLVLSLPAVLGILLARHGWQRGLIGAMAVLPLVTMPSMFGYAWMLLSTSRVPILADFMRFIGWNTPGRQVIEAGWVMATWLWPIPCWILVSAFRRVGAGAYHMALLDASPMRAFFQAALPTLKGPLIAALSVVFILAATDSTIPPLVQAMNVWSEEIKALASAAQQFKRPAAFLFFQALPMLGIIALLALASLPGLRQMTRWGESPEIEYSSANAGLGTVLWWAAALFTAAVTLLPFAVFCIELWTGRTTPMQAVTTAWITLWRPAAASAVTAVCVAGAALGVCAAVADDGTQPSRWKQAACALLVFTALLPPELSGTALVSFYSRLSRPEDWWSLYDRTPWPWTAAMIVRFGFLPACVVRMMSRRVPAELVAAAASDGATPIQRLVHTVLPFVRRPLVASCMMIAALTISEVAISVLLQPPRFIGGSLAVAVDSHMHYGRQNETVAGALMLGGPAIVTAGVFGWLGGRSRRSAVNQGGPVAVMR